MNCLKDWLILLIALMLIAPVGFVSASGDDDDIDDDDIDDDDIDDDDRDDDDIDDDDIDDDELEHEMRVEQDDEGLKVTLKREVGENETKIEFKMDVDEAKFRLKYEDETEVSEVEQKLSVELKHLVEYRDSNGDGTYNEGEDIVSAWGMSNSHSLVNEINGTMTWGQPTIEDINVNDIAGKKMSVAASMGENSSAQFRVDLMVFGQFNLLGGDSLAPTEVKIDFVIQDYDYQANDTALALMLRTKTKQEQEYEHEDIEEGEEGVVASSTTGVGTLVGLSFTWKSNATVDGMNTTVPTTTFKTTTEDGDGEFEHKQDFALSYARGELIVHDPTAGVTYDVKTQSSGGSENVAENEGFLGLPGFSAIIGIAAISLASFMSKRRE